MKHLTSIQVLGDSILKGIQLDQETGKYRTENHIGVEEFGRRYGVTVRNDSHFGCTVLKGERLLNRMLERGLSCDAVVMDFGGNDCDFNWAEVAADPSGEHLPRVSPEEFTETYRRMIRRLKEREILPILTNLPPLEPQWFFDWWCRDLDKAKVLEWLGDVHNIYAHQENYSRRVERLAREEDVPLVDVRGTFLDYGHLEELICADGTHPNSRGQACITQAFLDFGDRYHLAVERSGETGKAE